MDDKNLGWSAKDYAKAAGFASDWRDDWWNQDYLELLAKRWRITEARDVLDVGCGAGHWGQRIGTLLTDDARIVGVDHEEGFFEAAAARALGRPHHFEYRRASAEALPFTDASFDLVTCQTVLIHVADAEAVLREMVRVLRPGGLILAAEPNNLINCLALRSTHPSPPFGTTARLLVFDEACLRGKRKLHQGDGTVGGRLPAMLQGLGLEGVQAATNDRCATLVPPYDTAAERTHIEQLRGWAEAGISRWGDQDQARRFYAAGGGAPADFDELWALELASQRSTLADIDAGKLTWGGGFVLYAVAGRKP